MKSSKKAIRPNTKAVFAETIANPALRVLDIEKFAALAKAAEAPLLVDNTLLRHIFVAQSNLAQMWSFTVHLNT